MSLLSVFVTVLLPVIAVSAAGYLLGRLRGIAVEPLNSVAVYVLLSALVFHSLATTTVGTDTVAKLLGGVGAYVLMMVAVAAAVGRLFDAPGPLAGALVLTSAFPNSGNYGIPLAEFAFGPAGRDVAVLFPVSQTVLFWTVGVYVVSRGADTGWRRALRTVFRLPMPYVVVGALLARWLGVVPSAGSTAMATLSLVGNAAIPMMLVVLGVQLSTVDYAGTAARIGIATLLKMGVAPLIGIAVALALGFDDPTAARVFVLEASMPAAVSVLVLLIEVGDGATVDGVAAADYASAAVFVTTLLSVPVVTLLLAALDAGLVV